jgi:hypothetical protein
MAEPCGSVGDGCAAAERASRAGESLAAAVKLQCGCRGILHSAGLNPLLHPLCKRQVSVLSATNMSCIRSERCSEGKADN